MPQVHFSTLSPEEYKNLKEFRITYGFTKTPFGPSLIGIKDEKLCYVSFYDEGQEETVINKLKSDWPDCTIDHNNNAVQVVARKIFQEEDDETVVDVLVKGTEMQINVWKELMNIKPGTTLHYEGVAQAIGKPSAVRSVASAVGKNKVAFLIPCHRVINKNGGIGKYGCGVEKKKMMLKYENAI